MIRARRPRSRDANDSHFFSFYLLVFLITTPLALPFKYETVPNFTPEGRHEIMLQGNMSFEATGLGVVGYEVRKGALGSGIIRVNIHEFKRNGMLLYSIYVTKYQII